ncbi:MULTISPECIES: Bug family tripartite tricarboxylate transporter substrate binding protein [Roseomonadaceae]|uniref:Tripartite tricarboxylate transporter substrate binding protein n=1 Tax=Falsiroseomonas oleicola TaxID=2801474 RepID=A0ABS6H115_9PROT|nr:tripartite tricarboxylate transporter substrate-binding protein [Roseomonas oleicola]MBU8542358.1 tripartite tricarboxylate transporter substrate binding protein [Roseomonas oleicola]
MFGRRALLGGASALAMPAIATAQPLFTRPVRFVLGFAAGGAGDITVRMLTPHMQAEIGQPIVVDNRPGAGGLISGEAVARAAPDGHTMYLLTTSNMAAPAFYRTMPFDVTRDFAPVGRMVWYDHVIAVNPRLPVNSLAELIAYAKARPGALNIGSIAVGNAQHLGVELFRAMAQAEMTTVTFRSSPELILSLSNGDVQVAGELLAPLLPHVRSGAVKLLAVTAPSRFPTLPEVPTSAESGLPDYIVRSWNAVVFPARTPRPLVEAMNRAIRRALAVPEIRTRLIELGGLPEASSPEELGAMIPAEVAAWGRMAQLAGVEKQ